MFSGDIQSAGRFGCVPIGAPGGTESSDHERATSDELGLNGEGPVDGWTCGEPGICEIALGPGGGDSGCRTDDDGGNCPSDVRGTPGGGGACGLAGGFAGN